jgi:molecular chaperone Hsp33
MPKKLSCNGVSMSSETRIPSSRPVPDTVLPFQVDALDVRGRVVRLGPVLDKILKQHDYPWQVSRLLGEMLALTTLLGSALKFSGKLIAQTQTDGPVSMLVADFQAPNSLRGMARFDPKALALLSSTQSVSGDELLGTGSLVLTIDPGKNMKRHQGIVELRKGSLQEAALRYFSQSEQIPTDIRIAVGQVQTRMDHGMDWHWQAGGLLSQFLPRSSKRLVITDLHPGDAPEGQSVSAIMPSLNQDEAWQEASVLTATLRADELLDPGVTSEQLLFRLFHERGVRVHDHVHLEHYCSCSRGHFLTVMQQFDREQRQAMLQNGKVTATCDFCSTVYSYDADDLFDGDPS